MIQYPKMSYYNPFLNKECICFEKLDGNNFRVDYNRKKGFYKFGSRTELIDETNILMGDAIPLFRDTISDKLENILLKKNIKIERGTFFFEYYGLNSFGGVHQKDDEMKLILIDVYDNNNGFMKPEEFIKKFYEIKTPRVIYKGILDNDIILDIKNNIFDLKEGAVAKGTYKDGEVWSCKIKTNEWLEKIKNTDYTLFQEEIKEKELYL